MEEIKEAVRWNIKVSKETDLTLRTYLGAQGMKKGDLSKFIEEAVRWRIFNRTVQQIKARNAGADPGELQAIIDAALLDTNILVSALIAPAGVEGPLLSFVSQSFGGHFCAPWMTFAISTMSLRIRYTTTKGSGGKGSSRVPSTRPFRPLLGKDFNESALS